MRTTRPPYADFIPPARFKPMIDEAIRNLSPGSNSPLGSSYEDLYPCTEEVSIADLENYYSNLWVRLKLDEKIAEKLPSKSSRTANQIEAALRTILTELSQEPSLSRSLGR